MRDGSEIERLIQAFEDTSLPRTEWTHQAHLIVALWYLHRHPRDLATQLIRDGIQRYNAKGGKPEGYHETITLAWIAVVTQFLTRTNREQPLSALAATLLSECGHKNDLLGFYSEELLMSSHARKTWVAPDLQSID